MSLEKQKEIIKQTKQEVITKCSGRVLKEICN